MTAIPTSATGGFNQPRENTQLRTAPTRGARTRPLPRRNYCPGAFARWRAVADPHLTPPQEIRVETWIELVGMLTTALRAGLLNSPQSVMHSGACGELNLLINDARMGMGVGHAGGVAIKRSSCRQRHGVAVFSAHGQFFAKKTSSRLAMLVAAWCSIEFSLLLCPHLPLATGHHHHRNPQTHQGGLRGSHGHGS